MRKSVGRKIVRKDRAKAHRKVKQQDKIITKYKRKYETLKKILRRKKHSLQKKTREPKTPYSKVEAVIENVDIPPEVRKNLLFHEALTKRFQEKAYSLKRILKKGNM